MKKKSEMLSLYILKKKKGEGEEGIDAWEESNSL